MLCVPQSFMTCTRMRGGTDRERLLRVSEMQKSKRKRAPFFHDVRCSDAERDLASYSYRQTPGVTIFNLKGLKHPPMGKISNYECTRHISLRGWSLAKPMGAYRIVKLGGRKMINYTPQQIYGNWVTGVALDLHTTSSVPLGYNEAGYMQYDTTRPEIAQLLYRLKYQADTSAVTGIVEAATHFLLPHRQKLDFLVPVPPSKSRTIQPVTLLTNGISAALSLPVANCITATRATTELKGVDDPDQRRQLMEGLYAVDGTYTAGKNVLLFDDVYRSGTTLNTITDLLLGQGQAASVRVLTITKTRSHQ